MQLLTQSPGHINQEQLGRFNYGRPQSAIGLATDLQGHNDAVSQSPIGHFDNINAPGNASGLQSPLRTSVHHHSVSSPGSIDSQGSVSGLQSPSPPSIHHDSIASPGSAALQGNVFGFQSPSSPSAHHISVASPGSAASHGKVSGFQSPSSPSVHHHSVASPGSAASHGKVSGFQSPSSPSVNHHSVASPGSAALQGNVFRFQSPSSPSVHHHSVASPGSAASQGNVSGFLSPDTSSVHQQHSAAPGNSSSPSLTTSRRGLGKAVVPLGTPAANQALHQNPQYQTQKTGSRNRSKATFDKTPFGFISRPGRYDPNFDYVSLANILKAGRNLGQTPVTDSAGATLTRVASSGMPNNEFTGISVQGRQNIPPGDPEDHIQRETTAAQHLNVGTIQGRIGIDAQPSLKPVDQPVRSKKIRSTQNPFVEERDTQINNAAPGLNDPSQNPESSNFPQDPNANLVNPQFFNASSNWSNPPEYPNAVLDNPQFYNTYPEFSDPSQSPHAVPANPQFYNTYPEYSDPSHYPNAVPDNPQFYNTYPEYSDPSQSSNAVPANPQFYNTYPEYSDPSQSSNAVPANPQFYNGYPAYSDPSHYPNAAPNINQRDFSTSYNQAGLSPNTQNPKDDALPGNEAGLQSTGSQPLSLPLSVATPGKNAAPRKAITIRSPSPGPSSKQAPTERADPPKLAGQSQNSNVESPRTYASIAAPANVPNVPQAAAVISPKIAVDKYVPSDPNKPTSEFFFF